MSNVYGSTILCSDFSDFSDFGDFGDCGDRRQAPAKPTDALRPPAAQAPAAKAIGNVFESGTARGRYDALTVVPGDTGRLTYGRAQVSLGSGNLHLLVERYCASAGARFGARLRAWLPELASRSATADADPRLHNLLRAAADDPVMRDVQDTFFDEVYAQDGWGLALPRVARRREISLATLAELPSGCYDGPQPGSRVLAVQAPLQRGLDVRLVQLALSDLGCALCADGVFGNATSRFVAAFQRASDLPDNGVADPALIHLLLSMEG